MKTPFVVIGIVATLLGAAPYVSRADVKEAPAKVLTVTRDNFVSLELLHYQRRGSEPISLRLDNSGLRIKFRQKPTPVSEFGYGDDVFPDSSRVPSSGSGFGGFVGESATAQWNEPASMSASQTESLLKFLNDAQLPQMAGRSYIESYQDGDAIEVLTLTLSDTTGLDQKFEVRSWGNTTPPNFYKVINRLHELQAQKFSEKGLPLPEDNWITTGDLFSLTLEEAGSQNSVVEVKRYPMWSSQLGWMISWSLTAGEQKQFKKGSISPDQFSKLLVLINIARLANSNGKRYRKPDLGVAGNETLTINKTDGGKLTVSDQGSVPGDPVPAELSALIRYLGELKSAMREPFSVEAK